jgi:NADPH-dependent ferric siderophore reductase
VVDFALHDAGPATLWAMRARPGDTLQIGGPRGSAVVPDDFDYYLLIGDETALPAIGRRLEELRPGAPVTTVVTLDGPEDEQTFRTATQWRPIWVHRDGACDEAALLRAALADWRAPAGDGFVWIATEAMAARAIKEHMIADRGHPKEWLKAAGYWIKGEAGATIRLES